MPERLILQRAAGVCLLAVVRTLRAYGETSLPPRGLPLELKEGGRVLGGATKGQPQFSGG